MKVGIIGYEVAHKKVLEVALGIRDNGLKVKIFGFPFKRITVNKEPIFRDRPKPIMDFSLEEYLEGSGIEYIKCKGWGKAEQQEFNDEAKDCEYLITCIAKIIPASITKNKVILNTHPGILPYNRGVDAFKRAVTKNWPIGITLHEIDENIDAGTIIKTVNVPIFKTDTLEVVCERAYNIEVRLLVESSLYMDRYKSDENKKIITEDYKLFKESIDRGEEEKLSSDFRNNIDKFIAHSMKEIKNKSDFQIH